MKISFIILTWNRHKFLEKCLKNLTTAISGSYPYEIIIMDNGSTDLTTEILESYKCHPYIKIIRLKKNYGIAAYKKLFSIVKGDYTIIVDDDVLGFPAGLDQIFIDYMENYRDYGFIALNVTQNKFTDGAKPSIDYYSDDIRKNKVIERGPTGGWCTCFRTSDYKKIKWRIFFSKINMKYGEDGMLCTLFQKHLKLKSGLIKDAFCFHACGPYYAQQYGHLEREIEKYQHSGLDNYVELYSQYRNN